jgi:excisionase family DNA binding protein
MQTYQTISGRTLDLTGTDPARMAFLKRFRSMAATSTHSQMIAVGYGIENPIMDLDAIPGRGAVTAEIIFTPAYQTMTDILFRKQIAESGTTVEQLASRHTLTPAEAAERLGVTVGAVRQAIDAGRLGVWMKGGRAFIDPKSLAAFKISPRGPKARQARASTKPLAFCAGTREGKTLHIRFAGEPVIPRESGSNGAMGGKTAEGVISPWRRVGVFTGSAGKARFVVLTPADHEEQIAFGSFYVRGAFQVEQKINNTKAAKRAWQEFMPA